MKIKKINIISFGKLYNKRLNLNDGFNIIYGENESGKSTMQTFIKTAFYGISSKRTKDLRENERLRYLSLNDHKAQGELVIENEYNEYIITRTFGSTKKEDTIHVIDSITGQEIEDFSVDNLGKYIFGVNGQAFENTMFIKQLGGAIKSSKEDDIMHKIANSFQTGNENVSYQKAKESLELYKKSFVTQRKGGSLDLLKSRYDSLLEERNTSHKLAEANLNNEKLHIDLSAKRNEIEITIKKLEIYKRHLKKLKLKEEYSEITEYLKRTKELERRKEEFENNLSTESGIIDLEYLDGIQEELTNLYSLLDIYNHRKDEKEELVEELNKKDSIAAEYINFDKFDLDVEEKILKVSIEQKNVEEKISNVLDINEEINNLYVEINNKKDNLRDYSVIKQHREEIDDLLDKYEESLKELKFLLNRSSNKSINEKDVTRLKKKSTMLRVTSIASIIVSIVAVAVFLTKILPLNIGIVLLALSIIIFIVCFTNLNKNNYTLSNLHDILNDQKQIEALSNIVEGYEKEITVYFNITGSLDYVDFKKYLNIFDRYNNEIMVLEARINEKQNSINNVDMYKLEDSAIENEKIINSILTMTKCDTVDEFVKRMKQYRLINKEIEEINTKIEAIGKSLSYQMNDIEKKKSGLYDRLKRIGLDNVELDNIAEEIKNIKYKIQQREEIVLRLKAVEETYKALLKDRDIQAIENEIKEIINETIEFSYENEEEIEKEINIKQKELLDCEKDIKDIEYSIKNIFLTTRRLDVIEEDIEAVKQKIKESEKIVAAIEIAQAIMDESFKEIQKIFGPVLNKKVSDIFSKITRGKYSDVKVTENFDITVKQESEGRYMKAEYLSNGAWDQAYIALRLAIIDMIFDNKDVPIILDDAFVQYDDIRLENILEYLYDISKKRQIIIFTCQNREINFMKEKNDINIINI